MQNVKKDQKEETLIGICIKKSHNIFLMKKALVITNQLHTELGKISKVFPSESKVKELSSEIRNAISEQEMMISKLLKPLFESYNIPVEFKYWFTKDEIEEGYVLLRTKNSMGATHVLFLRDMKDTFDGRIVKEGMIYPYDDVNHFLKRKTIKLQKNEKDT